MEQKEVSIDPLPSTKRPCLQEQTLLILMKLVYQCFILWLMLLTLPQGAFNMASCLKPLPEYPQNMLSGI